MSALARYFHLSGALVAGYDKISSVITKQWEADGIHIFYEDDIDEIPPAFHSPEEGTLIVYTPAVPADARLLSYFREHGFEVQKRSQALADLAKNMRSIAVAGTHGKTTTSSMLAQILNHGAHEASAFVGGIMPRFDSNVVVAEQSDFMVLEADEFDRSFHRLNPEMAIITSTDADHLDIYGDGESVSRAFIEFSQRVSPEGRVFFHHGIQEFSSDGHFVSYGIEEGDLQAKQVRVVDVQFVFDVSWGEHHIEALSLPMPGRHNVLNALAAIGVALDLGLKAEEIKAALAGYQGVKRRFELIIKQDDLVFIDDYAHHPTELEACISAVRELLPNKKITGVFQPHLFTRTRDFMAGFGQALAGLDELILLPIYPARELPIAGVDSQALFDCVPITNKLVCEKEELPTHIADRDLEVLLTLGAGDIDRLVPILKTQLQTKYTGTSDA